MRVRNEQVVKSWIDGKSAKNHRDSLETDGNKLYSYALLIGDTCEVTKKKILRDYTSPGFWQYHSQTTSCHIGLARRYADIVH